MGDGAESNQAVGVAAGKAALLARPSLWKSAIVIAPLIGTALLLATGTQAQTSASTTPPTQTADTATVAPNPAPDAARKKGPKGRSDSGRTEAALEPDSAPAEERRREGPKGDSGSGRTEVPAPDSTPAEGRRKGPKGAVGHGRTEAPAPDTQPTGRRREGPKGDGESGRTEAPAPDTQPAGRRREGPKGDGGHGRTSTTPLIIGALSAAAVLALVVSSGNDRPASP